MSVKSPQGLVLYCYLNMPTINKTYLILSYLILSKMEVGLLTLTKGERLSYGKLLYFIKDGSWSVNID